MTTDLDWLARNVHEWGDQDGFYLNGTVHVGFFSDDICVISILGTSCNKYTRDQWQSRRAELQNKPSWDDAPDWADSLVQTDEGNWWWGKGHQSPNKNGGWYSLLPDQSHAGEGEVLGDWRDTLEKRPDIDDEVGRLINNAFASKSVKPLTRRVSEWNGEGMPPVGTVCEGSIADDLPRFECEIVHYSRDKVWFTEHRVGNWNKDFIYKITDISFRPLCTEEDRAVEEMRKESVPAALAACDWKSSIHNGSDHQELITLMLRYLYRAGYRKQECDK